MITPAPGYIVDPTNPNGVIRDPSTSTQTQTATAPTTATPPVTVNQPTTTGDAQVLANQQAAAKLGISIPGVGGGTTAASTASGSTVSPEDQKLLNAGVSQAEIDKMKTQEGLDPMSFQGVINKVEEKFKSDNELTAQRQLLLKGLFDSKLTPDELAKLPKNMQDLYNSGNQDAIQLQVRALNDQIAGRNNTLSQSIGYLVDGYKTAAAQTEKQKNDAIGTVVDFVKEYGSKAPGVLESLYGPSYMTKLREMGIDINAMSKVTTLAQDKEARLGGSDGSGTSDAGLFTPTQLNKGAANAGASLDEFKALPYEVKNYLINNYSKFKSDLQEVADGTKTEEDMRGYVNDSPTLPQSVKDYLNSILDKTFPKKASTPSFLDKAEKVVSDTASGAWSEIKSWFGK